MYVCMYVCVVLYVCMCCIWLRAVSNTARNRGWCNSNCRQLLIICIFEITCYTYIHTYIHTYLLPPAYPPLSYACCLAISAPRRRGKYSGPRYIQYTHTYKQAYLRNTYRQDHDKEQLCGIAVNDGAKEGMYV